MDLTIKTVIEGKPTGFVNKIWMSLLDYDKAYDNHYRYYFGQYRKTFGTAWDLPGYPGEWSPKHHMICEDQNGLWILDKMITFVTPASEDQIFQFAPVVPCRHVDIIFIVYRSGQPEPRIFLHNKLITDHDRLARNEGYPDRQAFYRHFDKTFLGKIIHWTPDIRY